MGMVGVDGSHPDSIPLAAARTTHYMRCEIHGSAG